MKDLIEEAVKNGKEKVFRKNLRKQLTDDVYQKMIHPKHESMGYPLTEAEILAVILYTDTLCCTNLRKAEQGRIDDFDSEAHVLV